MLELRAVANEQDDVFGNATLLSSLRHARSQRQDGHSGTKRRRQLSVNLFHILVNGSFYRLGPRALASRASTGPGRCYSKVRHRRMSDGLILDSEDLTFTRQSQNCCRIGTKGGVSNRPAALDGPRLKIVSIPRKGTMIGKSEKNGWEMRMAPGPAMKRWNNELCPGLNHDTPIARGHRDAVETAEPPEWRRPSTLKHGANNERNQAVSWYLK